MEEIIPFSVCVNYADYLETALQHNRKFFKEYHIVTTPEDTATQDLCKAHNVEVHLFDDLYKNSRFNKSGMIHKLQKYLHLRHPDKWMLVLDADICLPDNFETLMKGRLPDMNKECMYSLPRNDVHTYEDYVERKNIKKYPGLAFAGFFQLYFNKTTYYPEHSTSCRSCDIQFYRIYKSKAFLLDESPASHLLHLGQDTVNHHGRESKPWKI